MKTWKQSPKNAAKPLAKFLVIQRFRRLERYDKLLVTIPSA